jgi:TonB-dependent SusC/RagA subfamily outer membrane receptor
MKKNTFLLLSVLCIVQVFSQENKSTDISICWDTSFSMAQRDLDKDLVVLENYFEKNGNAKVQVIYFNLKTVEKEYTVSNGDWNELKSELKATQYDGASIYSTVKAKIKYPNVYVFTDGNKLLERDNLILPDKSFIINSSPQRNAPFLERMALVNRARLVDVANFTTEAVLSERSKSKESGSDGLLKGTVYIDNKPAAEAKVAVKGISDSFLTDGTGSFAIEAEVGDTLLVTSVKSRTLKMVPIEKMAHTTIFLEGNTVELDEVVLVEKRQEEELEMVGTGFASYDKKRLGYEVATVDSDEISSIETNAGDALRNKVAGVNIDNKGYSGAEGGLAKTNIRGQNSLYMDQNALVVIDGVPTKRGTGVDNVSFEISGADIGNLNHIDPSNIAKITVLKGLAATNQWGSEGVNGVILITTKTASGNAGGKNPSKIIDRARLKNNIYKASEAEISENDSAILKALAATKTLDEAYETYLTLRNFNFEDVAFYLNAFSYFRSRDSKLAAKIISNVWEANPDDTEKLRLVAMALGTLDDHESEIKINEQLMATVPNDVNVHLNNALAFTESGSHQQGLDELIAMAKGSKYFSMNTSGISKTLDREIKNLLFKHRSKVNTSNIDSKYLGNLKYKARLVFEWNHPGAEFELQFVNPQNRFFNWKHTTAALGERIQNEIQNNYRIEEFEFSGDVQGKWVFNAESLEDFSNKTNVPLILKCTIYTNFGYPDQGKEQVLVYFNKANEKRMVKTLMVE